MADEPTPDAPKAEPKAHAATHPAKPVTLALVALGDKDTFVAGDVVITTTGTPVPSADVDDLIASASACGLTLRKV